MTGSRWGWMLALPVLAVPLLPHAGGSALVLVAALLATIALVRQAGVARLVPAECPGFRRPGADAGAEYLRTPIRSCDPDGRGHTRPRAPGRSGLPRA